MRRYLMSLLRNWTLAARHSQPRDRRAERGMNLLEIMVVLVIISLVAGTVGVAVMKQLDKKQLDDYKKGDAYTNAKIGAYELVSAIAGGPMGGDPLYAGPRRPVVVCGGGDRRAFDAVLGHSPMGLCGVLERR